MLRSPTPSHVTSFVTFGRLRLLCAKLRKYPYSRVNRKDLRLSWTNRYAFVQRKHYSAIMPNWDWSADGWGRGKGKHEGRGEVGRYRYTHHSRDRLATTLQTEREHLLLYARRQGKTIHFCQAFAIGPLARAKRHHLAARTKREHFATHMPSQITSLCLYQTRTQKLL